MKYFPLVWAALWRKRARTLYTMLSIVVAFLLYGLLQGFNVGLNRGVEVSGADRLITAGKYSFTEMMAMSYYERIRAIPGVKAVSHATWFGGVYQDEKNFFPQFPVDQDTYFTLYPEIIISPEALKAFQTTRTGALVGAGLAKKYGWKVGDRIPLQASIWPNKETGNAWVFDLVGIMDGKDAATQAQSEVMLFRFDYFDEGRQFGRGLLGWFIVQVANPSQADAVSAAIDKEFANSSRETRTDTEKAFNQAFLKQLGDIQMIITSILGAVFFTLLFLTGNTMMQSVRERVPELAVLKTLGFSDFSVLTLVLVESLLLCVIAAVAGIALAWVLLPGIAAAARMPGLGMTASVLWNGIGIAILLAAVVGLLPAWRAKRLDIVNALAGH